MDNRAYWESQGGTALSEPPSDVWRRNFRVTFQNDLVGLVPLDFCNEDHILWASDYPHPDSTFPDSERIVAEQMAHTTPEQRRTILRENPIALYGLEDRAASGRAAQSVVVSA